MPGIFISYRRGATAAYAGRLYDRLAAEFGERQVFMDLTDIEPGVDFVEQIERAVGDAEALLVVIGPDWLEANNKNGLPRLHDPEDFVRQEVLKALERETLIVPVLVQGAPMPLVEELPEPLHSLGRRNAIELTDTGWSRDVDRLVAVLTQRISAHERPDTSRKRRRLIPWALAVPCLAAAIAIPLLGGRGDGEDKGQGTSLRVAGEAAVGGFPVDTASAGGKVWVQLLETKRLKVIDAESREVTDSRSFGLNLAGLAAARGRLWVGDYGKDDRDGRGFVVDVDPVTGKASPSRIPTTEPYALATDGKTVWVTDTKTLSVIDVQAREVTAEVTVDGALDVALLDGSAWVVNEKRGELLQFDARTGEPRGQPIDVGAVPTSVDGDGPNLWVTTAQGQLVRVPSKGGRTRSVAVGGEGYRVVEADEGRVWVVDEQGHVVLVDPSSLEVVGRLRLNGSLQDLALADGGAWIVQTRSSSRSTVARVEPARD